MAPFIYRALSPAPRPRLVCQGSAEGRWGRLWGSHLRNMPTRPSCESCDRQGAWGRWQRMGCSIVRLVVVFDWWARWLWPPSGGRSDYGPSAYPRWGLFLWGASGHNLSMAPRETPHRYSV